MNAILPFDKHDRRAAPRLQLCAQPGHDDRPQLGDQSHKKKPEEAKERTTHLVVIGASHLKRTQPHLRRLSYEVTEVTCPGWTISAATVENVLDQLRGTSVLANAVVIINLFGIVALGGSRWMGRWATAVKMGGGYHMPCLVNCV